MRTDFSFLISHFPPSGESASCCHLHRGLAFAGEIAYTFPSGSIDGVITTEIFMMFGTLVPIGGGDDIPLKKKEMIVGRKEECDIVLRFSNVSGRHCKLVLSNGYWYVVDLNSSNGVKVNGVRVTDRRIDPGAKVMIAGHAFHLDYNPADNGAIGAPPPDLLDADVFSKSLMDRIGLSKTPERRLGSSGAHDAPKVAPQKPTIDYDALSIDDIEFKSEIGSRK